MIINLAGKNVFSFWSKKTKKEILESRLNSVTTLIKLLKENKNTVKHFISSSATGVYANNINEIQDEFSEIKNQSFLANVVMKWEKKVDELSELNKNSGPLFKIDNDPRLIKGAAFIRKFSIDEIPQFLNVLKGEMSIVGPRPLFPEDNEYFDKHYIRRLNVMPGITGLLQINERNTDDFDTWYRYDIEYIDNWSITKDIEIIIKTPFSLLSSKTSGK